MTDLAELASSLSEDIERAVTLTEGEIMGWAKSTGNNGPFSEEAYRTNIHVCVALRSFAEHLKTALRAHLEADK